MNTPIADFVESYAKQNMSRMHMPGHKGKGFLGCEVYDITEVKGADSLYEADGIIAESEANATKLFGTGRTVYSTEGSSQCIRAMLYLATMERKEGEDLWLQLQEMYIRHLSMRRPFWILISTGCGRMEI